MPLSTKDKDKTSSSVVSDVLGGSEAHFREFIETIPGLVWVCDATGSRVFHNRRWYEYTGRKQSDNDPDHWHDLLHPDDADGAIALWEQCKATGQPYSMEYRLRRADGMYRWFLSNKTALHGAAGIEQWVGICTDIDDRMRAHDELRESAGLLKALTDGLPDAVFVKDLQGRYLLCNSAAGGFMGQSPLDILGKTDADFFDPPSAALIQSRDQRIMDTARTEIDEEVLTVAGVTRTFLATKGPYYDSGGTMLGVIGISRDVTHQKKLERVARDNDAKLAEAVRLARIGYWSRDLTTGALEWSDMLCKIFGVEPATFRRTFDAFLEIVHPDDRELVRQRIRDAIAATSSFEHYYRIQVGNEIRIVHEIGTVATLENGQPIRIAGTARDVTSRSRAEEAVRVSEERFRAFMDHSPAASFIKDASCRYQYVNATWLKQFDPQPVDWEGQTDDHFWPPETAALFHASDLECLAFNRVIQTEETGLSLTGERLTWLVMKFPLRNEGKLLIGGMAWEISDWKRTEDTLHLRDRAISAVTQGIIITDSRQPDDPIIYVNRAIECMTGYSSEEFIGRNCRLLQGKDTDPTTVAKVRHAIAEGKPCTVELLNYRKDGTPFWNELSLSPMRDGDGTLTHFVGIQVDVTARRSLEEQYRQSQKMEAFGQLAGGVAHDFNNLLTVINGYSEMLLEILPMDDSSREPLAEIHKAGVRSAGLTRQLLSFSRQQVLAPRILDLNTVVKDTEKLLRRLIGEDVHLVTRLDPRLDPITSDPGQLEQVLLNLAVNSRDAMPQGGTLTIETRNIELCDVSRTHPEVRTGHSVMLIISDTGGGMSDEVRSHVFEPFFTTKERGKGTGLGLAVVHGIVQQSEGHIEVSSVVGNGTTFRITFPRAEPVLGLSKSHLRRLVPPEGKETVLLVEDDSAVRALSRVILTGCGYTVLEAANGDEAVKIAAVYGKQIDIVITDVVMPGVGGRIVAERLAQQHPGIRVLYVSGYMDDAVVRHGVLREGVNFLQKPFSRASLASKVRNVLDAPIE